METIAILISFALLLALVKGMIKYWEYSERKKIEKKIERNPIKIGDVYTFNADNPFETTRIMITDYQNGFVQYGYVDSCVRSSMSVSSFLNVYEKIK